jgi:hypothetical protein
MSFLRPSTLSLLARRAAQPAFSSRPLSTTPHRFAAQGYGDGKGDPKGENPQSQGGSNGTKHNAEHPGPEPPSVGQGTGAGPTKAGGKGSKSPEDASAQSGGARSKDAKETGSSPTGGSVGGGKDVQSGASSPGPKIHDHSTPSADSKEKQAEVEQHNKEFEEGHDRAPPAEDDKVDKRFWSGESGPICILLTPY